MFSEIRMRMPEICDAGNVHFLRRILEVRVTVAPPASSRCCCLRPRRSAAASPTSSRPPHLHLRLARGRLRSFLFLLSSPPRILCRVSKSTVYLWCLQLESRGNQFLGCKRLQRF